MQNPVQRVRIEQDVHCFPRWHFRMLITVSHALITRGAGVHQPLEMLCELVKIIEVPASYFLDDLT